VNTVAEARSLKKLAGLQNLSWIITAHYGATGDFQKAFRKWR
jgi:hypothetical protein